MKKPKISYYLRTPSAKDSVIMCTLYHKGQRKRISTGIEVPTLYWNKNEGRPYDSSISKEKKILDGLIPERYEGTRSMLTAIIMRLRGVEDAIEKAHYPAIDPNNKGEGVNFGEYVTSAKVSLGLQSESNTNLRYIIDFSQHYVEGMQSGKFTKKGGVQFSHGTLKQFKAFVNFWNDFEKWRGTHKIRFKNFSSTHLNDLNSYFSFMNWGINYKTTRIKQLKKIAKVAKEMGIHENDFIDGISTVWETVSSVWLTASEIEQIYNCHQIGRPAQVRDLFLIGCYTGLRISDYTELSTENIQRDADGYYLSVTTKKTGEPVSIPINAKLLTILNRYKDGNDYNFPRIPDQKINEIIKQVAKSAGINKRISYKGESIEKWEKISSHTGRRSAASNWYLAGVGIETIRQLLGHTATKQTRAYIGKEVLSLAAMIQDREKIAGNKNIG